MRQPENPKVKTCFAMAYNPYGPSRADYVWSYPKMYMPFEQTVIIGHEFWNIVGGWRMLNCSKSIRKSGVTGPNTSLMRWHSGFKARVAWLKIKNPFAGDGL